MKAARNLHLHMPTPQMDSGPCTPTFEFANLLALPRQVPGAPDVSGLNLGLPLTPSPPITGKRGRKEDWAPAEVKMLQSVLARPPKEALFPPGSMPPPHILDELTSAVVHKCDISDTVEEEPPMDLLVPPATTDMDGYDASAEPSPCVSGAGSRSVSPGSSWPHSWEETREKLAALALAETRLGHEREDRKLTRQERRQRPGLKHVGSMDFLDVPGDAQSPDKIGRVLKLSSKLQSSTRDTPPPPVARSAPLARAASMGPPPRPLPPTTPPVARPILTLTPSPDQQPFPSLMRRRSSARSDRPMSRRPSLLARGRSFTASDLEAEEAEAERLRSEPSHSNALELESVTPSGGTFDGSTLVKTPTGSPERISPRRRASAPEGMPHRLTRSHSYQPGSDREPVYDIRGSNQSSRESLGLGLPPPPVHAALGGAFDASPSPPKFNSNGGWDSDSDREGTITVKRRARRPLLAMTAMAGAAAATGNSPSLSPTAISPTTLSTPLKVTIGEQGLGGADSLGSPFEERQLEL